MLTRTKLLLLLLLFPIIVHAQSIPVAITHVNPTILRSGPSEDYDRIAELPKGLRLEIKSVKGGWTQVRVSQIVSGWIDSKELEDAKPGASASHPVLKFIKIEREKDD